MPDTPPQADFLTSQQPRPSRGVGALSAAPPTPPLDLQAVMRELCSSHFTATATRLAQTHPGLLIQLSVHPRLPQGTRAQLSDVIARAKLSEALRGQQREALKLQLDELSRSQTNEFQERWRRRVLLTLQQLARQGDARAAQLIKAHLEQLGPQPTPSAAPPVRAGRVRVA